jgi:hypothetical protein
VKILPANIRNMTDEELFREAEFSENPVALALAVRLMSIRDGLIVLRDKCDNAIDDKENIFNA